MVGTTSFILNRRLLSGPGSTLAAIATVQKEDRVLVIVSKSVFTQAGTLILEPLAKSDVIFFACPVTGEPTDTSIDDIVRTYYGEQISTVIGVGGGSALDTAKAVSAMLRERKLTASYLEGSGSETLRGKKAGLILIPTTAGTGSEATANAVILCGNGSSRVKKSLRHPELVPEIAVHDPIWLQTLPKELVHMCACDCLSQLTESFLSVKSTALTDALATESLRRFGQSFPGLLKQDFDEDAAMDLLFCAWSSGVCLTYAGLGTPHGLAGALGAATGLPHAKICAGLLIPSFRIFEEKAAPVWKEKALRAAQALSPSSRSLSETLTALVGTDYVLDSKLIDDLSIRKIAASCNDRNSAVIMETEEKENLMRQVFSGA